MLASAAPVPSARWTCAASTSGADDRGAARCGGRVGEASPTAGVAWGASQSSGGASASTNAASSSSSSSFGTPVSRICPRTGPAVAVGRSGSAGAALDIVEPCCMCRRAALCSFRIYRQGCPPRRHTHMRSMAVRWPSACARPRLGCGAVLGARASQAEERAKKRTSDSNAMPLTSYTVVL